MKHVLSVLILISLVLLASCEGVGTAEFNDAPQATNSDGDTTTTGGAGGGGGGGGSITFAGIDSVSSKTDRSASLNWTVHADAVAYEVYRVVAGTPTLVQYINNPATVTYAVTGLSANTSYTYVVVVRDAAGDSSSLTTTTSFTTNSAPSAPTGLALNDPASSPGTDSTPTITVSGVNVGDTITLYDSTCTTSYGSAVAAAATVNVTTSALTDATYTFKATATNPSNNESACSTATVSYEKTTATNLLNTHVATAAYSLRKIHASATYAIKVRRSSDDTTQDIGFTGDNLNTAALLTFVGSGDGYVHTWYDQTGNGHHAVMTTNGSQPQIVASGSVIEDAIAHKPAVYFDGSNDYMGITNPFAANMSTFSVFLYTKMMDNGDNRGSWLATSGGTILFGNDSNRYYLRTQNGETLPGSAAPMQYKLVRSVYNGTNFIVHENGVQKVSTAFSGAFNDIGRIGNYSTRYFWGHISEMIIYDTDKSASAAAIETDINTYFAASGAYAAFDTAATAIAAFTLSNSNLTAVYNGAGSWRPLPANKGKSSGKWYFEVTINVGGYVQIGAGKASMADFYLGSTADSIGYTQDGTVYMGGSLGNIGAIAQGNVIGIALDLDSDRIYFYKNGTLLGSVGLGTWDGFAVYPAIALHPDAGPIQVTANFGASAFSYPVPNGFHAGVYD